MNYVPHTDEDRKKMLEEIGVSSIDELFNDLTEDIHLTKKLNLPEAKSEQEVKQLLAEIGKKNITVENNLSFLGAGTYNHFIPSIVSHLAFRSEFYTAYTPYQPEISQGMLQSIFEFQTLMCELLEMDVTNASMYDGASASAEAALSIAKITKKSRILIPETMHPEYRKVIHTYCNTVNIEIIEVKTENGLINLNDFKEKMTDETAGIILQNPNFFGGIESVDEIEKIVHDKNGLLVLTIVEPTSLGLIKAPGDFNADIVVGEGQGFGNPMAFGGPHFGFYSVKKELIRTIPGRLVGETVDTDGNRGFIMTLQTREQHIRREKASSNICSNEALNALAASIHLAWLGKEGLKELAELNYQNAHYAFDEISKINGFNPKFNFSFYNEFVIECKDSKKVNESLLKKGIFCGVDLEKFYPEMKNCLLINVTEKHSKKEIDFLISSLKEVIQ